MDEINKKFFAYKDKPLVRSGNTIYYGSMLDEYVVMLQIQNMKKVGNYEVPDTIVVQLMKTDKSTKPQDVIAKKADKHGLSNALDIAEIWLKRAL